MPNAIITPKRILFIKLCCIGDVLFSTPTIRAFRRSFPDAHIAYLIGTWTKDVVSGNPHVNEVIIFDAPYLRVSRIKRMYLTARCIRQLRRKKFDTAVVFHRTASAGLLTYLSHIKHRIGFDYGGRGFAYTAKIFYDDRVHEVDRYLSLAQVVGVEPAGIEMEMQPTPAAHAHAEGLLSDAGVSEGDVLVAMQPGGGHNPGAVMPIKQWGWQNFAQLSDELADKYNAKIILIGGKIDFHLAERILSATKNKPINLVGKTTFLQLSAVQQRCRLFIGGDSGPLHIAAAVGIPTVGLFGPSDPRLVAPRGEKHTCIWKQPNCAPCYTPESVMKGDFESCPTGKLECMKSISIGDVMKAVSTYL